MRMPVDARTLAPGTRLETDFCIIGGGPAGIALALELAGVARRVILLEAGGMVPDRRSQAEFRLPLIGHHYFAPDTARVRAMGGGTARWGGWSRSMDESDFAPRACIPDGAWPFDAATLAAHDQRVRALCELRALDVDLAEMTATTGHRAMALPHDDVATVVCQFSPPTNFATRYASDMARREELQVFVHAPVVDLCMSSERSDVSHVEIGRPDGTRVLVTARRFILAGGAIENARLLLASRAVRTAGLGNEHDLVGRYFGEHPHLRFGVLRLNSTATDVRFYDETSRQGRYPIGLLAVPPHVARREALPGFTATLVSTRSNRVSQVLASQSAAFSGARELVVQGMRGRVPDRWRDLLSWARRDPLAVLAGTASRLGSPAQAPLYELRCRTEQIPNRDSRVLLTGTRDSVGMQQAALDWRLTSADIDTITRGTQLVGDALRSHGIGTVFVPEATSDLTEATAGGWHQMGTTRMSRHPRSGVVDADCRVHSVANLYVAGSSVFPTYGTANPTMTLLALTLRLADHLRCG